MVEYKQIMSGKNCKFFKKLKRKRHELSTRNGRLFDSFSIFLVIDRPSFVRRENIS